MAFEVSINLLWMSMSTIPTLVFQMKIKLNVETSTISRSVSVYLNYDIHTWIHCNTAEFVKLFVAHLGHYNVFTFSKKYIVPKTK